MATTQTFALTAALLLGCVSCTSKSHVTGDESIDSFSVTIGGREFQDEDWEPVESPAFVALNFVFKPEDSWVDLDFGLAFSRESTERTVGGLGLIDLTAEVVEGTAGLYKELPLGNSAISLYAGAGVALLVVDAELTDSADSAVFDDDDVSLAPYARVGLQWNLDRTSSIGIDLRHVTGSDINIGGFSTDADYTQVGVIFRYIP